MSPAGRIVNESGNDCKILHMSYNVLHKMYKIIKTRAIIVQLHHPVFGLGTIVFSVGRDYNRFIYKRLHGGVPWRL